MQRIEAIVSRSTRVHEIEEDLRLRTIAQEKRKMAGAEGFQFQLQSLKAEIL
jgi:hypothetical protein